MPEVGQRPPSPDPDQAARLQLVSILRWGLAIRVVVALLVHWLDPNYALAPDQWTYDWGAKMLLSYWSGESFMPPGFIQRGEPSGYYYVVAVAYFLITSSPLVPRLINAYIGMRTISLTYDIAVRITGRPAVGLL